MTWMITKGIAPPIDIGCLDRLGRHRTQEEQGEAERRMHERCLHIDAEQHAEPDQIDSQLVGDRTEERHDDERQLEEIEEERQQENQEVDHDQESHLPSRQIAEQMLDPTMAIDRVKSERENPRADQDEKHESRQLRRAFHRLPEQSPVQALAAHRQDQGARRPHGAALGRRGDPQENRAENEENEQQRRHQRRQDAHEQLPAPQRARFDGQGRRPLRPKHRNQQHIADVQAAQHDPRDDCPGVHVADRLAQLVGHDDQNQRGRNDLRQRSRSGNDPRRQPLVVSIAQHDGQ